MERKGFSFGCESGNEREKEPWCVFCRNESFRSWEDRPARVKEKVRVKSAAVFTPFFLGAQFNLIRAFLFFSEHLNLKRLFSPQSPSPSPSESPHLPPSTTHPYPVPTPPALHFHSIATATTDASLSTIVGMLRRVGDDGRKVGMAQLLFFGGMWTGGGKQ